MEMRDSPTFGANNTVGSLAYTATRRRKIKSPLLPFALLYIGNCQVHTYIHIHEND